MTNNIFLVDTSAWIFALRKNCFMPLKNRIDTLLEYDAIITTGIIKLELLAGTRTINEYNRLKKNLDILKNIENDVSLWETSFETAFSLRRQGITIPNTDIMIAACTIKSGATIVHADQHFDIMSKHLDIRVESYVDQIKNT